MITEIIGTAATVILMGSSLPQIIQIVKSGHAAGMNIFMLISWTVGLLLMLIYIILADKFTWVLGCNYIVNVIMSSTMLAFRLNKKTKDVMKKLELSTDTNNFIIVNSSVPSKSATDVLKEPPIFVETSILDKK